MAERWAVEVQVCERIVISAGNAIAWAAQTNHGPLVVKWSVLEHEFIRLTAAADLQQVLHEQGLPVAPPSSSVAGGRRFIDTSGDRPLSVTVQPTVEGYLLDVADPTAVHAAGAAWPGCTEPSRPARIPVS